MKLVFIYYIINDSLFWGFFLTQDARVTL